MPILLPTIDEKVVRVGELESTFTALAGFINAGLDNSVVELGEVEYRHLADVPRRVLALREDAPVLALIGAGWYVISNITPNLPSTSSSVNNQDGSPAAVVQVEARLYLGDWISHDATAQFILVYSTDNGATWNIINSTVRPIGIGSGLTQRYFDSPTIHYWGGAPGYVPPNQPYDGVLFLLGSFGGEESLVDPQTITHYGIAVDNAGLGVGPFDVQFFLRTRRAN